MTDTERIVDEVLKSAHLKLAAKWEAAIALKGK